MASPLILDTSGIVALYDADSREHRAFVAVAFAPGVTRILPSAILSEVDYMLSERVNPLAGKRFLDGVVQGFYEVEPFIDDDARYVQRTIARYPALSLGLADCAVMSLAERLGCPRILTTDRRHFLVVKPRAFAAFELVEAVGGKRQSTRVRR
ncbi:MAG: type II toxin-antitoxin system VapC family toxin [Burkholderiales bacterium]